MCARSNRVTSDRYSIQFDACHVLNQRPFLGEERKTSARAECFLNGIHNVIMQMLKVIPADLSAIETVGGLSLYLTTSRLLKNLVLERFSWRCGSKKRSDGSRSALHRRRWLRFCLIFDAPDGLIPLRPEAWGRERDCRRQQSGRRTIPPSRAHDAGSCANRRRSSSSQRVLRSACA